jgi:hypothetical protein
MPKVKLSGPERATIRQYLADRFSLDELQGLASDLAVDYQNLHHATKIEFALDLFEHTIRMQQLSALLKATLELRPDSEVEVIYQRLAGQFLPTKHPLLTLEARQRLDKMLRDSSSFVQDRLASFVGRAKELTEIKDLIELKSDTGGYITITGQAGQGKSSIIAKLVQEYGINHTPTHFIPPFNPGPDYQVSLLRDVLARLILKYNLSDIYVASESRQALRDFFFNLLKELSQQNHKEVIFIDGLDQLEYDQTGYRDLSFLPERPPVGILFVLGTRPDDTLAPLELLNPSYQYKLPNLTRTDFDLILAHRKVKLDFALADRFYTTMQENVLYLDLVAKELAKTATTSSTVNAQDLISQVSRNPDNIFTHSINRLKRQKEEWWEVLKPVLGLLLVAQEPLRKSTLRRILKVDEQRLRDGLHKLAGLVASDSQDRYYLYHLKLYDYLRQDLKNEHKDYIFDLEAEKECHQQILAWCEQGELASIWDTTITPNLNNKEEQDRRGLLFGITSAIYIMLKITRNYGRC